MFFENCYFLFFVNNLNCLFDFTIEIEVKGFEGKLYVSNFIISKVDEISVVSFSDLFFIKIHLVIHEHHKMSGKFFYIGRT